ncbi:MAG: hypothetical protein D6735_04905 [Acidobacteria bacterium]|nr:MAG: hypothetical protein D6735_04905 [Acidobacteriota bacterium]
MYTGSIYAERDPSPLFRAIKLLEDQNILINNPLKVIVAGYYFPLLDLAIEREGVKQYVEFRGLVPRPDALRMQRDADALLHLDIPSEGILTGKVFEYLVAGPPILVVGGNAQSSVGALVEECQRGKNYRTDVEALASDLIHLLHEKRHKRDIGNKTINIANLAPEILQFSREEQARKMLKSSKRLWYESNICQTTIIISRKNSFTIPFGQLLQNPQLHRLLHLSKKFASLIETSCKPCFPMLKSGKKRLAVSQSP